MTRTCIALTGTDRHSFLQNLVTNQVAPGMPPTYAALLSPQGKYIADFFVFEHDDTLIIDVAASHAPTLAQKLMIYRLRADVQIEEAPVFVHLGLGDAPDDGFADPRHSALGWRAYRDTPQEDVPDLVSVRIAHGIPETGIELHADSYILEMGFERLSGVDFKKGCYVGQEVTARMKHKTELRKGLAEVALDSPVAAGADILSSGKPAGKVHSVYGETALAYLRFDRAEALTANDHALKVVKRF